MSEEMVVRQAAPTLAGIKTGSLFPCPCTEKETLLEEIRAFNRRYLSRGLCLLPLRFTEGKALLYLYRPAALRRDLRAQTAETLLAGAAILRNAAGVFGMLAVLGICVAPFLNLEAHYLLYKGTAALAATAAGSGRLTGLIEALGTAFGLILAMTASCAVLLTVAMVSAVSAVG